MITKFEDLAEYEFKEVTIRGTYQQFDVHMRQDSSSFVGYVKVVLNGGFVVLSGKRSVEEIKRFEDKDVDVKGIYLPSQTLWSPGASPVVPLIEPTEIHHPNL